MQFDRFRTSIIEMIKEQQIKLGYVKETVRLYLPANSLYVLLDYNINDDNGARLANLLTECRSSMKEDLGNVDINEVSDDRFCITVSPAGCEYIHKNVPDNKFLVDIIELFRSHSIGIDDVKAVFAKYSSDFKCEQQDGTEFDYLLYFTDKSIDEYYYCVKFDCGHASYHRFSEYDLKSIV